MKKSLVFVFVIGVFLVLSLMNSASALIDVTYSLEVKANETSFGRCLKIPGSTGIDDATCKSYGPTKTACDALTGTYPCAWELAATRQITTTPPTISRTLQIDPNSCRLYQEFVTLIEVQREGTILDDYTINLTCINPSAQCSLIDIKKNSDTSGNVKNITAVLTVGVRGQYSACYEFSGNDFDNVAEGTSSPRFVGSKIGLESYKGEESTGSPGDRKNPDPVYVGYPKVFANADTGWIYEVGPYIYIGGNYEVDIYSLNPDTWMACVLINCNPNNFYVCVRNCMANSGQLLRSTGAQYPSNRGEDRPYFLTNWVSISNGQKYSVSMRKTPDGIISYIDYYGVGVIRYYACRNNAHSTSYTSPPLFVGDAYDWGNITYVSDVPSGSSISVQTRTGNTRTPDSTWTAWSSDLLNNTKIPNNINGYPGAYVQYKVVLTADTYCRTAPTLTSIKLNWLLFQEPTITGVEWQNLIGSPITTAEINDTVKLVVKGQYLKATEVNATFNISKEGWFILPPSKKAEVPANVSANWKANVSTGTYLLTANITYIYKGTRYTKTIDISKAAPITINAVDNSPPVANISAPVSNQYYDITQAIDFISTSYDVDDPIVAYEWNFGDGVEIYGDITNNLALNKPATTTNTCPLVQQGCGFWGCPPPSPSPSCTGSVSNINDGNRNTNWYYALFHQEAEIDLQGNLGICNITGVWCGDGNSPNCPLKLEYYNGTWNNLVSLAGNGCNPNSPATASFNCVDAQKIRAKLPEASSGCGYVGINEIELYVSKQFPSNGIVSHQYASCQSLTSPGSDPAKCTANVTLKVTDSRGFTSSKSMLLHINNGSNQAPAIMMSEPTQNQVFHILTNQNITFNASKTIDDKDSIGSLNFTWSFDAETITFGGIGNSTIKRPFDGAGNHNVTLTVTDLDGFGSTVRVDFSISGCGATAVGECVSGESNICNTSEQKEQRADLCDHCPAGTYTNGTKCSSPGNCKASALTTSAKCNEEVGCFWFKLSTPEHCEYCNSIDFTVPKACSDYKDSSSCTNDRCDVGKTGLGSAVCGKTSGGYRVPMQSCICKWNGTVCNFAYSRTNANVPNSAPEDCIAKITATEISETRTQITTELNCSGIITSSSQTINKPGALPIPFFTFWNMVIVIGAVAAAYIIINNLKKKPKVRKRRK